MNANISTDVEKPPGCETCPFRKKAESNPKSLIARLWKWHTRWCPGWKAYQEHLAQEAQR